MWPLLCLPFLILFQTAEILTFCQYLEANVFGRENWKLSFPKLICDLELLLSLEALGCVVLSLYLVSIQFVERQQAISKIHGSGKFLTGK